MKLKRYFKKPIEKALNVITIIILFSTLLMIDSTFKGWELVMLCNLTIVTINMILLIKHGRKFNSDFE